MAESAGTRIIAPDPGANFHAHAFDEVLKVLVGGLRRLSMDVEVSHECRPGAELTIVLAPHLQELDRLIELPRDSILYNWEPLGSAGTSLLSCTHLGLMSSFRVWEYSQRNLAIWREVGARSAVHVPLGYDPTLETLPSTVRWPRHDVFFYGSLNDRRIAVLRAMDRLGLDVKFSFGSYGEERDRLISECKIVLNMHFYGVGILELPRLSYLWANRKPVLVEMNDDTEDAFGMRGHCLSVPYASLAEAAAHLCENMDSVMRSVGTTRRHFMESADSAAILLRALKLSDAPVESMSASRWRA